MLSVLSTVLGTAFTWKWFLPVPYLAGLGRIGSMLQVALGLTVVTCLDEEWRAPASQAGPARWLLGKIPSSSGFLCRLGGGTAGQKGVPLLHQLTPPTAPSPRHHVGHSSTQHHRGPEWPTLAWRSSPCTTEQRQEVQSRVAPGALCCSPSPPCWGRSAGRGAQVHPQSSLSSSSPLPALLVAAWGGGACFTSLNLLFFGFI